ncbi:MAG: hypothetical protein OYH77_05635, partial [Pseudomonadota bacterium]|nr:hypothetical protein [Pseudomonadota bacterium]
FVSSLALPADKRLRLTGQVVNCLTESSGNFSIERLEEIEAGCIARVKDILMRTVKIGEEGWLEKGFKKGLAAGIAEGKAEGIAEGKAEGIAEGKAEIALRMLAEGMSAAVICRTTGLNHSALTKLKRTLA